MVLSPKLVGFEADVLEGWDFGQEITEAYRAGFQLIAKLCIPRVQEGREAFLQAKPVVSFLKDLFSFYEKEFRLAW